MSAKKRFSCTFIFDELHDSVILTLKHKGPTPDHPNGQQGQYNGTGGGMESQDLCTDPEAAEDCVYNTTTAFENIVVREGGEELDVTFDRKYLQCFRKETYQDGTDVQYFVTDEPGLFHKVALMGYTKDKDPIRPWLVENITHSFSAVMGERFVWNVPYLVAMGQAWLKNPTKRWVNP